MGVWLAYFFLHKRVIYTGINNDQNHLKQMVYAAMFGALTAIGSLVVIPLQPLPITLQTLFTGLAGILFGAYTAALSQIIYVLLGVIGLPVFAGGKAGLGTLLGPSGGYLIGFIAGSYIIGRIVESNNNPGLIRILVALVSGTLVIYILGTIQLAIVTNFSLVKSLMVGVVPFLPGDGLKIAISAWLGIKLRRYVNLQR